MHTPPTACFTPELAPIVLPELQLLLTVQVTPLEILTLIYRYKHIVIRTCELDISKMITGMITGDIL
jgi:hypothetical protein